jgi:predicted glutamine amidotransferase
MAKTEHDGFGAAWLSPKGKIMTIKSSSHQSVKNLPSYYEGFAQGHFSPSNGGPLLIHGRTATCNVDIENTHPIKVGQAIIIHNGVVDSTKYKNLHSTCDSELILQAYQAAGMQEVAAEITGYYAFGILHPKGKGLLTIARDDRAPLFGGITEFGEVFATTQNLVEITGATIRGKIKDNVCMTFQNNVYIGTEKFTPKRKVITTYSMAQVERSMGQQSELMAESAYGQLYNRSTNWRQDEA